QGHGPLRRHGPSSRFCHRCLYLAAVAVVAWVSVLGSGFLFPAAQAKSAEASRVDRSSSTSPGRRELLGATLFSLGFGAVPEATLAAANKEVTQDDLDKLVDGYRDLTYLMENWNKATRKCEPGQDRIIQVLASGQQSPDTCIAKPDEVRKYLGIRSTKAKLFNTKQKFIDIEMNDMVPNKDTPVGFAERQRAIPVTFFGTEEKKEKRNGT
ncbi:unnamed protein product, partial [Polarella glacialis]